MSRRVIRKPYGSVDLAHAPPARGSRRVSTHDCRVYEPRACARARAMRYATSHMRGARAQWRRRTLGSPRLTGPTRLSRAQWRRGRPATAVWTIAHYVHTSGLRCISSGHLYLVSSSGLRCISPGLGVIYGFAIRLIIRLARAADVSRRRHDERP